MNISPDDFEKLGIDESNLDEKAEQTTYKIRCVARYVRQWVRIEANRKEIQQINFIDCMCNAGVYKDGDACTALEVIEDFNGLAKQFPSKKFVVYLNDIDKERIKIFDKIYQKYILPQKSSNLQVHSKNKDVNDYLDMIAADSQNKQGLFAYGKCNLIYVDPYNFGTVQISKLHAILENNYCELLFNLFTSDYVRNIAKDTGRIQKCLGGFKPATKDEFINCVTKELHVGHVKFTFSYSFHTMKNVELYQILYATPSIRGLEVLKDSLWDVFGGEEFHRNHVPKTSDVEQISFRKNASISSIEVRYCPKFCSPVVCSTKFTRNFI